MALYDGGTTMLMVAVQSKALCPISKDVTKQVRCNMLRAIQKQRQSTYLLHTLHLEENLAVYISTTIPFHEK